MGRVHHACPMTVLMCAAAAALVLGTVPHAAALVRDGLPQGEATVAVAHPKGIATATVRLGDGATVDSVSITRTARRLLTGEAYL
jgi:2-methylaconitate cis-trans-isomerase PrpF